MDGRQYWTHTDLGNSSQPWISSRNGRGKSEVGFLFKSPCEEAAQVSDTRYKFQFPSTPLPVHFLCFPPSQVGRSLCPISFYSSVPPGEFHNPPGRNLHSSAQSKNTLSSLFHVAGCTEDHQKYGENAPNGNDGNLQIPKAHFSVLTS
jgi:hypothetical protein